MDNQNNYEDMKVPVDGKLEPWNPQGSQSDGSTWSLPRNLCENHEHVFILKSPDSREAVCTFKGCGIGGMVYPHNADLVDGKVIKK